jgi:hypothetical protein
MQAIDGIFYVVILIMSVVIHEFAHGYSAYLLGDNTARLSGRLTLNPLKHLDIFGSIVLPLLLILSNAGFVIGWARPVPYNPNNLRKGRWGNIIVSGAGVGAAGAGAAAGRFAGLSPFGRILTAAGVGGYYLSKKTGGKFDEDVSRFGQQWSEADGFWGHLAVVPKWVGQTTWAAITDGWGDKFNAILHPSQKLHDAWRGFLDWFMDGLRGVNDWFVDQINRTFSVTIPGTDITIGPNLPHAKPPGAARGGTVLESGLLEVGEAGRETLALTRDTSFRKN